LKNSSLGREFLFREDLNPGNREEYPLLEAVIRQLLLNTLRGGKDITCDFIV
jgi:hypothetical protein